MHLMMRCSFMSEKVALIIKCFVCPLADESFQSFRGNEKSTTSLQILFFIFSLPYIFSFNWYENDNTARLIIHGKPTAERSSKS